MHKERNFCSGSAPGGRISFSEGLLAEAEIRKSGTIEKPNRVAKSHLRRSRLIGLDAAGDALSGNLMAAGGTLRGAGITINKLQKRMNQPFL
jgi:hypothetical protein